MEIVAAGNIMEIVAASASASMLNVMGIVAAGNTMEIVAAGNVMGIVALQPLLLPDCLCSIFYTAPLFCLQSTHPILLLQFN